jgi:hypothetical protein
VVEANWPEKMVAREGAQNTPAVWALVKLKPRLAKRSILGVMAAGVVLWHPIQSFMSSTARNKTLGLLAASTEQTAKTDAKTHRVRVHFFICFLQFF